MSFLWDTASDFDTEINILSHSHGLQTLPGLVLVSLGLSHLLKPLDHDFRESLDEVYLLLVMFLSDLVYSSFHIVVGNPRVEFELPVGVVGVDFE